MQDEKMDEESLKKVRTGLQRGSRYRHQGGSGLSILKSESRCANRDILTDIRVRGELTLHHAYVLFAVHTLGHATPNMVRDLLISWKQVDIKKDIREYSSDAIKTAMRYLASKGLLLCQAYKADRHMIRVYTITSYGFNISCSMLDKQGVLYDVEALYRSEKEIFKHLAVNAVAAEMAKMSGAQEVLFHGRYGGFDKYKIREYLYGGVDLDGVLYLMEPTYFRVDEDIETESESIEKVAKRLLNLPAVCGRFEEKYQKHVRLVLIVEDSAGILTLVDILRGLDDPNGIYQSALITCENIFYVTGGNLNQVFLRWRYDEKKEKVNLTPYAENWRQIE